MHVSEIPTPALLLDRSKLEDNLEHMASRARSLDVRLRPHIKTHKCVEVAHRQLALGAAGLTVSTLHEAREFAAAGFSDLTWAVPVILNRIDEVLALAERCRFSVLVDGPEAVSALVATRVPLRVFLKVDCGYHRAGVDPLGGIALYLAQQLSDADQIEFEGILTHAGHSYHCQGQEALLRVARQERDVMARFADRLRGAGIDVPVVSVGSTPTMSVVQNLEGIDEIRPGNYVFYDASQVVFGAATVSQCALTVLSSVISCQPGSGRSLVDAGALALSKDAGPTDLGHRSLGTVFSNYAAGELEAQMQLTALSQEHGHVNAELAVGRRIRILPNHSCLTAAQFDVYHVVDGDEVVDRWRVLRGRG